MFLTTNYKAVYQLHASHSYNMFHRFNRLSLKKQSNISNMQNSYESKMDDDLVPSNQEALFAIPDLDLTINLPEGSDNSSTIISEGLGEIRKTLQNRLTLAKRKESLRYGIQTGKFPTWFHTRSYCALNLDGEGNEKFEKFWRDLAESQNKQTAQLVLDYVEAEIKTKELESNQIRNQTLQAVRRQTVDFEIEKRRFDENITKINQDQITEIQESRSRLATATQFNSQTRDQSKRPCGRPFRRPGPRRQQLRGRPY